MKVRIPVVHSGGTVLESCPLCTDIFAEQPIQFLTLLDGALTSRSNFQARNNAEVVVGKKSKPNPTLRDSREACSLDTPLHGWLELDENWRRGMP